MLGKMPFEYDTIDCYGIEDHYGMACQIVMVLKIVMVWNARAP